MRLHRAAAVLAAALLVAACSASPGASGALTAGSPTALPSTAASAAASPGGASAPGDCPTAQPAPLPAGSSKLVTIKTAKGTIAIKVDGTLSPIAAGNFVALAQCGYYTGVVFHRLVPGFVIQAGDGTYGRMPKVDPNFVGTGGPSYTIQDEPVSADYTRGTVAMAKTSQPNSANSQFFIVLADLTGQLPKNYQIFGHVTAGMDAVDAIAAMPNSGSPNNTALQPVSMDTVTVSNP